MCAKVNFRVENKKGHSTLSKAFSKSKRRSIPAELLILMFSHISSIALILVSMKCFLMYPVCSAEIIFAVTFGRRFDRTNASIR